MLRPVLVTPPAMLPVSLVEAKRHLHQDDTDRDLEITALLKAAVAHYDGWTGILGRCLVEQTWRQDYEVACQILPLPLGPIIDIVEVGYTDAAGNPATVAPSDYEIKVDAGGRGGVLIRSEAVPYGRPASVTYDAGYATIPAQTDPILPASITVPDDIKVAIVIWVQAHFDPPSRDYTQVLIQVADNIIGKYRRVGV